MSDAITSTKLEPTGKIFWDSQCCLCAFLSPAHESERTGYLVCVLIVKTLSHRFCLNSATVHKTGRSYCGFFWGDFLKHF